MGSDKGLFHNESVVSTSSTCFPSFSRTSSVGLFIGRRSEEKGGKFDGSLVLVLLLVNVAWNRLEAA